VGQEFATPAPFAVDHPRVEMHDPAGETTTGLGIDSNGFAHF
jgi:hypothetical protein